MKVKKQKNKNIPPLPLLAARIAGLTNCKLISAGRPDDVRYTTPLLHPTTPMVPVILKNLKYNYIIVKADRIFKAKTSMLKLFL